MIEAAEAAQRRRKFRPRKKQADDQLRPPITREVASADLPG